MGTLCDLYADLLRLRNEVKKLERAMMHAILMIACFPQRHGCNPLDTNH
jgi:hypothetical protein